MIASPAKTQRGWRAELSRRSGIDPLRGVGACIHSLRVYLQAVVDRESQCGVGIEYIADVIDETRYDRHGWEPFGYDQVDGKFPAPATSAEATVIATHRQDVAGADEVVGDGRLVGEHLESPRPVSYTHLTLPTNREV